MDTIKGKVPSNSEQKNVFDRKRVISEGSTLVPFEKRKIKIGAIFYIYTNFHYSEQYFTRNRVYLPMFTCNVNSGFLFFFRVG